MTKLGVYAGYPQLVDEFGAWLGRPLDLTMDFEAARYQADLAQMDQWAGRKMVISVPMEGPLASGAAGGNDGYYATMARNLTARGLGSSTLRIGWEFNACWMPWCAALDPPNWQKYWRKIVTAMRVPGSAFKFDWCAILGAHNIDASTVYPGNAFVDYIGLDIYDSPGGGLAAWKQRAKGQFGLDYWVAFAASKSKPLSVPEWGLVQGDWGGGGDDVVFVEKMAKWMATNNVAYHCYFNTDASGYGAGDHRIAPNSMFSAPVRYPNAANRYRELFR